MANASNLDSGLRQNDGKYPLSHVWERVRVRATVQCNSFKFWIPTEVGMTLVRLLTLKENLACPK
jgi:hypothetical protein